MRSLVDIYPPFGLAITCGDLSLRTLRDDDMPFVEALIVDGVADPALPMPFITPWHLDDRTTGATDSVRFWWTTRGAARPENWAVAFVVRRGEEIVGIQDLGGKDFGELGVLVTGSWVGRRFHGHGIGTRMRQLVAAWGFDALGARELRSGYIDGNRASEAVSRKVGYQPNGYGWLTGEYGPRRERQVVLTPETFVRPDEPVAFEGTDAFRRFVGLDADA